MSCQQAEKGLSLEVAMGMYGLEHFEMFWEKAHDTKLLLAWSDSRMVLAFRGTASMSNALSDVQVSSCSLADLETERNGRSCC